MFAEVILPLHLPFTLTYGVPVDLQQAIIPGMRVEVNMGKNKVYAGVVLSLHQHKPEQYQVKPIRNLIDDKPIVTRQQLAFWQWIAQYYLCSIGDVMKAALPAHLKLMSESLLVWNEALGQPPLNLSDHAYILAEALFVKKQLTIEEVRKLLDGKSSTKIINELLENEVATVSEQLEERYAPKTERFVFLEEFYEDEKNLNKLFEELNKSPKLQQALLTFFQMRQQAPVALAALQKKNGVTAALTKALIEKHVLRTELIAIDRLGSLPQKPATLVLSEEQQTALQKIHESWATRNTCLLHGVTGSGKTLIYIQLIKEAIGKGSQALFLLPEIALTTQVVGRLRAYFGNELGVYHSRFTNNERVEIWNKVKDGTYKAILGPRSALWLPFDNLQYLIVDEEHDASYKQYEPAPRFHARDAAVYLATLHGAKVLLGSATPSLESSLNAQQGKYGYVALDKRYRGVALPQINIVSAKETQAALSQILTVPLLEQINATLAAGKQVILFQNKRGYAPFLICASCGWVAHCRNCDVSLTYHKATDKLHCHYCGSQWAPFKHCPGCGNMKLVSRSFGTEKIEEELQRIFPKYKTGRMDWDSVKGKNKMAALIDDFTKGRLDILVGTQMVVKGLDFENVGLVGILSADSLLSYPDFRVNERGFQIMEQVSGRAGRMDGKGIVLIQAYNLKHPVLTWVKDHDYRSFFHTEIAARREFGYPPFTRMIKITCRHRNDELAAKAAGALAAILMENDSIKIQGPAPALVPRVRNFYLHELWLKVAHNVQVLAHAKSAIAAAMDKVLKTKGFSALQIVADVDPY
ncbi:MAG: primosomal protein N' [Edaphocola sp.]